MATITDLSQLDINGVYTYADYVTWQFEQTVELIKGKIFSMSPAPKTYHQKISRHLTRWFDNYLTNKSCELFVAPFDVRLYDKKKSVKAAKDIFTVVQPDLCVICDESKIDEDGCIGAPDLIIEILSKGNSKKEMRIKYDLYEESGVQEYLIADPEHETFHQFILDENGKYKLVKIYTSDDTLTPILFSDLQINLNEIFCA
jgi:Uma2 family endonuclease